MVNRRQLFRSAFKAATVASAFYPPAAPAQQTGTSAAAEGDKLYVNPATGTDTNPGAKASPLRTLAEAARRVNQSSSSGPMTIVLSEGIYAVGETTLLKPDHRAFSRTDRLLSAPRCFRTTPIGIPAGCRP